MQQPAIRTHLASIPSRNLSLYAFLLLLVSLSYRFARYLLYVIPSIVYPFELDYGEGIIWQQALLIPGEKMYGNINSYPFIVFHYPPLYHLAVRALSSLGVDYLVAGRGLTVFSTLGIAALVFVLTFKATKQIASRSVCLIASAVAALILFTYIPIIIWSRLMRVDMLGIALTFLGICLAFWSVKRPELLYSAVLVFVLALYTKQTLIAAPIAALGVLLLIRPKQAIKAIGVGLAIGIAGLLYLNWKTDGGFARHIIEYNVNRFSLNRLMIGLMIVVKLHWIYLLVIIACLILGFRHLIAIFKLNNLDTVRKRLINSDFTLLFLILIIYLILSTAMLVMVGKVGSSYNYFIEWMCVWSVIIGLAVGSALVLWRKESFGSWPLRLLAGIGLPGALICQLLLLPIPDLPSSETLETQQKMELIERIRKAPKPVLSEDMVLLMRAGKEVPLEPAVFEELTSVGRWDQQQIVNLIKSRFFEFVVTYSDVRFNRYTPAMNDAIKAAYPHVIEYNSYRVYLAPD